MTADHIAHDRADVRITVHPRAEITYWPTYARLLGTPPLIHRMITGDAGRPEAWWVSTTPLRPQAVTTVHIGRGGA